jgi:predicted GNAT family N-acyltransferase
MTLTWHIKHHCELHPRELYALLELRSRVFVVEQNCAYQDVDGQDLLADTHHLLAWRDGELVAYLRLLDPSTQDGDVVIGRVVIAPQGPRPSVDGARRRRLPRALAGRAYLSLGPGPPAGLLRALWLRRGD